MGISRRSAHQLVERYFDSFNQGQFEQTVTLFSSDGQLVPPFEGTVEGSENILRYLNQRANGMVATPKKWTLSQAEADQWQVEVLGTAKALAFQVTVAWQFLVSATGEIKSAHIRLVASPKELLSLRSVAAT